MSCAKGCLFSLGLSELKNCTGIYPQMLDILFKTEILFRTEISLQFFNTTLSIIIMMINYKQYRNDPEFFVDYVISCKFSELG